MVRGKRRLRPGPHLWGPRRAELGVSLRELESASGVNRGLLSLMENRGVQPRGDEFGRIMAALEEKAVGPLAPPADVPPRPPAD